MSELLRNTLLLQKRPPGQPGQDDVHLSHPKQGARYKQWDDLLDGLFCAYLAYYFWYWWEEGCTVVGDQEMGCVTLPRGRLKDCQISIR